MTRQIPAAAFAATTLLATAGLTAIPAAAKDLEKAVPAPTLLPCPAQGAGFARMPGSATCFRLSGHAAGGVDLRARRDGVASAPVASGRFAIDTRTESDFGPVRTFVRVGPGPR